MRRYIGERYVPIVDGAWDITKTYEPLTMVSNSNNIYISKNYVPAGVNISDTDYWALMMDYSSIIAELTEVHDDLGDIDDATAVLGNSAFKKINNLNNNVTAFTEHTTVVGSSNAPMTATVDCFFCLESRSASGVYVQVLDGDAVMWQGFLNSDGTQFSDSPILIARAGHTYSLNIVSGTSYAAVFKVYR